MIPTNNTKGQEKPTFYVQLVVILRKELSLNVGPLYQILEF